MLAFKITVAVLAFVGSAWIIWDLGWRGVYIVSMILVAILIERGASQIGWNPLFPVAAFIVAATLLGFRLFSRTIPRRR